jgi:hypothetical protein
MAIGICSVCFHAHELHGNGRPARHGFSINTRGMGHGHVGAWHSGPCFGTDFPNLAISCEGTKAALARVETQLRHVAEALVRLTAYPALTWTWERGRRTSRTRVVVTAVHTEEVTHGARARALTMSDLGPLALEQLSSWERVPGRTLATVPSYDDLFEARVRELQAQRDRLERAHTEYAKVIAEWTPEAWGAKAAAVTPKRKGPAIHLAATFKNREGGVPVPACTRWALSPTFGARLSKTTAEVTCTKCQKLMKEGA